MADVLEDEICGCGEREVDDEGGCEVGEGRGLFVAGRDQQERWY